jgi:hypothetical protein
MKTFLKVVVIAVAVVLGLFGYGVYYISPDGPMGYDEGARAAIYAERFAWKFQESHDDSATYLYTPKYGNRQTITMDLTEGSYCPNHEGPPCHGSFVTVWVTKGKGGNGYALGNAAAVPNHLRVTKTHGPIQFDFKKVDGVVEVVGLE